MDLLWRLFYDHGPPQLASLRTALLFSAFPGFLVRGDPTLLFWRHITPYFGCYNQIRTVLKIETVIIPSAHRERARFSANSLPTTWPKQWN